MHGDESTSHKRQRRSRDVLMLLVPLVKISPTDYAALWTDGAAHVPGTITTLPMFTPPIYSFGQDRIFDYGR
jgi:hypothetical protein